MEDRLESARGNFAGRVAGDNGAPIGAGSPPDFVATSSLTEEFTALFAQPAGQLLVTHQATTSASCGSSATQIMSSGRASG